LNRGSQERREGKSTGSQRILGRAVETSTLNQGILERGEGMITAEEMNIERAGENRRGVTDVDGTICSAELT
jgi:hypothetical protein